MDAAMNLASSRESQSSCMDMVLLDSDNIFLRANSSSFGPIASGRKGPGCCRILDATAVLAAGLTANVAMESISSSSSSPSSLLAEIS